MEKFVVSSNELIKKLNAKLAADGVTKFTIAGLGRRDGQIPNWEINAYAGFGPNLTSEDEKETARQIASQFGNHDVDWSL